MSGAAITAPRVPFLDAGEIVHNLQLTLKLVELLYEQHIELPLQAEPEDRDTFDRVTGMLRSLQAYLPQQIAAAEAHEALLRDTSKVTR